MQFNTSISRLGVILVGYRVTGINSLGKWSALSGQVLFFSDLWVEQVQQTMRKCGQEGCRCVHDQIEGTVLRYYRQNEQIH